jgi:hypothetical protein
MDSPTSIEKVIVTTDGKLRSIKIAESHESKNVIVFSCTVDGEVSFEVMPDDNGRWVQDNLGVTEYSTLIGSIIEDHFG